MVEEQRARIDEAMMKMSEEVDKSYIRVLQGKMFKCAAQCCEDKISSMKTVRKCIEVCSQPLENAENFIKDEYNHFQDRLHRCVMTCNDTIRDKMGPEMKDSDITKYTREFEICAAKCVDSHINLIPDTLRKIKEVLKKQYLFVNNIQSFKLKELLRQGSIRALVRNETEAVKRLKTAFADLTETLVKNH